MKIRTKSKEFTIEKYEQNNYQLETKKNTNLFRIIKKNLNFFLNFKNSFKFSITTKTIEKIEQNKLDKSNVEKRMFRIEFKSNSS